MLKMLSKRIYILKSCPNISKWNKEFCLNFITFWAWFKLWQKMTKFILPWSITNFCTSLCIYIARMNAFFFYVFCTIKLNILLRRFFIRLVNFSNPYLSHFSLLIITKKANVIRMFHYIFEVFIIKHDIPF